MSTNFDNTILNTKEVILKIKKKLILDISEINIKKGKITLLYGANGAGKTTLLRIIACLQKPTSGEIYFKGEKLKYGKQGLKFRRMISMLFQEPYLFQRKVIDNVMFGPIAHGYSKTVAKKKAKDSLKILDCNHLENKLTRGLSGGEKKRIAFASLLTVNSELLLLDEPTAQVDKKNSTLIKKLINNEIDKGKTIILSTHQPELVDGLKYDLINLKYGRLSQQN